MIWNKRDRVRILTLSSEVSLPHLFYLKLHDSEVPTPVYDLQESCAFTGVNYTINCVRNMQPFFLVSICVCERHIWCEPPLTHIYSQIMKRCFNLPSAGNMYGHTNKQIQNDAHSLLLPPALRCCIHSHLSCHLLLNRWSHEFANQGLYTCVSPNSFFLLFIILFYIPFVVAHVTSANSPGSTPTPLALLSYSDDYHCNPYLMDSGMLSPPVPMLTLIKPPLCHHPDVTTVLKESKRAAYVR